MWTTSDRNDGKPAVKGNRHSERQDDDFETLMRKFKKQAEEIQKDALAHSRIRNNRNRRRKSED